MEREKDKWKSLTRMLADHQELDSSNASSVGHRAEYPIPGHFPEGQFTECCEFVKSNASSVGVPSPLYGTESPINGQCYRGMLADSRDLNKSNASSADTTSTNYQAGEKWKPITGQCQSVKATECGRFSRSNASSAGSLTSTISCDQLLHGLEGYQMIAVMSDFADDQNLPRYETLLTHFVVDEPPRYSDLVTKQQYNAFRTSIPLTMESREGVNIIKRCRRRCFHLNSCKIYLLKVFASAMFVATFIIVMTIIGH